MLVRFELCIVNYCTIKKVELLIYCTTKIQFKTFSCLEPKIVKRHLKRPDHIM